MFFKFSKKGTSTIDDQLSKNLKEAAVEEAKVECQTLCNKITDDNTLIDFCATQFSVDWDEDGLVEGPATEGKWAFCEERIPCCVLVENCKNRYDGHVCREKLAELSKEKYYSLYKDTDGTAPPITFSYGCGLSYSTTNPDPARGVFPTCYNWKEKFCFDL